VRRETQDTQGAAQPRALADGLRQHHEATAVEQHYQRQLQLSNRREDCGSCSGIGLDHALARCECDSASSQFVEEDLRWKLTDDSRLGVRKGKDCTILRDYGINEIQISSEISQL